MWMELDLSPTCTLHVCVGEGGMGGLPLGKLSRTCLDVTLPCTTCPYLHPRPQGPHVWPWPGSWTGDGDKDSYMSTLQVQASPSLCWRGWLARLTSEHVGGDSVLVAFIDSESVAIATLWRILTLTVSIASA